MLYRKNTAGSFFLTKWVLLAAERLRLLFKKKRGHTLPLPLVALPGAVPRSGAPPPPSPRRGPGENGRKFILALGLALLLADH